MHRLFPLATASLLLALLSLGCQQATKARDSATTQAKNYSREIKGEEVAVLTDAPDVPPPITRDHATKMIVNLEVTEVVMPMTDGTDYTFWTFGGKVPGKFIRIREGDLVEFHLQNHPSSKRSPAGAGQALLTGSRPRLIEKAVEEAHPGKLRYLLISIDPEVDTPERLEAYSREVGLGPNWEFLHGAPDDVLELAALLGVKYKKTGDTDYAHSNIVTVLDRRGEVVHQQEGLGIDPCQSIQLIEGLLRHED